MMQILDSLKGFVEHITADSHRHSVNDHNCLLANLVHFLGIFVILQRKPWLILAEMLIIFIRIAKVF